MLEIVTRAEWHASPRVSPASRNIHPEKGGVAIHWGGDRLGTVAHAECVNIVRSYQRFHIRSRGWADIAYTYLVCQHGKVFEGRGPGRRTAANGTTRANDAWYAVCALMGKGDKATPELLAALRGAVEHLWDMGARSRVSGHRDHWATDCPGPELYGWLSDGMRLDGQAVAVPEPDRGRPPFPGRLLKLGVRGTDVRLWQGRLNRLGYFIGGIDGWYGPHTEAATRRFQSRNALQDDGIVGARTWAAAW